MIKINRYVSSDWIFTDEAFEKIRILWNLPLDCTNEEIRKQYIPLFKPCMELIFNDLLNDHLEGALLVADKTLPNSNGRVKLPNTLITSKHFDNYMLNQFNNLVGMIIGGFANYQIFLKEILDEKTAFYVILHKKHTAVISSKIINHSNKKVLLGAINVWLYEMKSNNNLLKKLPNKKQNSFLDFIADSIEYLKLAVLVKDEAQVIEVDQSQSAGSLKALTAFELALRHWYLVEGKIEENPLSNTVVGMKYKHLRSSDNIEKGYSAIIKKEKIPNRKHLENIKATLYGHPSLLSALDNDIAKLS